MDQAQNLRVMARAAPLATRRPGGLPSGGDAEGVSPRTCFSLVVTSGKGGVGKTNISVALAIALSTLGKKVLLFDGDLGLANVHILLGMAPKKSIGDVAAGICSIEDTLCEGPAGLMIAPGASGLASLASLDSIALERMMSELSRLESRFDFLIIDGGAGIGAQALRLSNAADGALVVVTPEPTSLADAYAVIKTLVGRSMRLSVVVNQADSDKDGGEVFEKLSGMTKKFLGCAVELATILPFDRTVAKMVRSQKSMQTERQGSLFAVRIENLARTIAGVEKQLSEGFFARMLKQEK